MALTDLASMGATGGMTGNFMRHIVPYGSDMLPNRRERWLICGQVDGATSAAP
jgi:hypothetical protein